MSYPGKKHAEKAVTPMARVAAEKIVGGRVVRAIGWWWLRRHFTRRQIVEKRILSRPATYRHDVVVEELFGKPVHELTEEDIVRWLGVPE